jgi:hypothetical protein
VEDVGLIFKLVGCTTCALVMYVYPSVFYLALRRRGLDEGSEARRDPTRSNATRTNATRTHWTRSDSSRTIDAARTTDAVERGGAPGNEESCLEVGAARAFEDAARVPIAGPRDASLKEAAAEAPTVPINRWAYVILAFGGLGGLGSTCVVIAEMAGVRGW